ncbi:MAG: hypothetical protein GC154_02975 [bacterium]|nr:hypothetical protein [bacterium]
MMKKIGVSSRIFLFAVLALVPHIAAATPQPYYQLLIASIPSENISIYLEAWRGTYTNIPELSYSFSGSVFGSYTWNGHQTDVATEVHHSRLHYLYRLRFDNNGTSNYSGGDLIHFSSSAYVPVKGAKTVINVNNQVLEWDNATVIGVEGQDEDTGTIKSEAYSTPSWHFTDEQDGNYSVLLKYFSQYIYTPSITAGTCSYSQEYDNSNFQLWIKFCEIYHQAFGWTGSFSIDYSGEIHFYYSISGTGLVVY